MKRLAAVITAVLAAASLSFAAEYRAEPLFSVNTGEQSVPADVVIESAATIGVYEGHDGAYIRYTDGKEVERKTADGLMNGNCFVESGDFFFFCDTARERVVILDDSLTAVGTMMLPKELSGNFDPTDIVAADGFAYVVDNDNHRVIKFDLASGRAVDSVGSYGEARERFWYPYAVAMSAGGTLLVSEVLNTRIQELSTDLAYFGFTGRWGVRRGELYRPTGLAVDTNGSIYVADGYLGFISVFDKYGEFADVITDTAGTRLSFGSPTHIRLSGDVLAVVDAFNRTVHVYRIRVEQ